MTTNAISTNGHHLLFHCHLVIWKLTLAFRCFNITTVDEGLQLCLPCMFKGVSKDALNAMRAFIIKHIRDKWHASLPTHDENGHQEKFKFRKAILVCSQYKPSNAIKVVPINNQQNVLQPPSPPLLQLISFTSCGWWWHHLLGQLVATLPLK